MWTNRKGREISVNPKGPDTQHAFRMRRCCDVDLGQTSSGGEQVSPGPGFYFASAGTPLGRDPFCFRLLPLFAAMDSGRIVSGTA